MTKPSDELLSTIGEMKQAEPGRCLSFEQLAELAKEYAPNTRRDTPEGETPICAYCGVETSMAAYTDLDSGKSYPACCVKSECLDKFEPKEGWG